ncbi:lipoprotein-releasing ABC transporter permease subunit LolC [Sodalis endosymbiont of Henestaris halophilus]|uniref:lipoprotein-releasing ABC transporter permease subunit LolC n=1 Tax=Sodalis endosymbiont of Henestaris halophilus TaxID=1929246 RepID=UPI000BBF47E3|nr:lipoprotein-releasing ABC transporter permease subunit LolC [Sodalis endosymbiont of Henestaris halophilus]SNC58962.1 Lipoprotein-releasing system transmembrane protein LolC [Sodalis endosymbiont of Henestaris halophilus]
MYHSVVLYIGLRYMRGRASDCFRCFISWLSSIAITLGVMAILVILSVMNGFERELESNILRFMPQALLTTFEGRLDPERIPSSLLKVLEGVTYVAPLTTSDVVLQSARSVAVGVMLGITPCSYHEPLSRYFLDARKDDLVAGQYRVILGDKLADALGVKHGDALRLIVPGASQLTPIGRISSQRLFTLAGTFAANSEVDGYQLLVNQQDASRLMRYPAGYVTGWRLWFQQPLAVANFSAQILPDSLVWHDWRERKGELFQAVRMEKNMMGLLLSLIVVVAAFNILTSLGLLVMEKQAEVAILQTQGLTGRQVMLVFVSQGAIAGITGTLLGTSLGILLAIQLNSLMPALGVLLDGAVIPVVIEPLQVTFIALLAINIALLSTIYPSYLAAAVKPAEVLRYE